MILQVCKSKFEEESLSKETADTEKAEYGIQEEKLLEEYRLAEDNQHEIHETTISAEDNSCGSVCFVKPSCYDFNFSEPNVTRNNETTQLGSKKANMSTISDELHEAQSRMIPKDDIAISFKVGIGCSSTVIELIMFFLHLFLAISAIFECNELLHMIS